MSSSLKDQLLKAGLVTEEQVAESEKKKNPPRKNKTQNRQYKAKANSKKNKREQNDLEHFYAQRSKQERAERQQAEKIKREQAALKKERNAKIKKLISAGLLDTTDGNIRYNFVVGTTVKYLFVTEQQQQQLIDGKLAITFNGGKRCLIPLETGHSIKAIDPDKIVIFPTPGDDDLS